jgi:hypothetical protein
MNAMQRWLRARPLRRLRTLVAITWLLASPPVGAQLLRVGDPDQSCLPGGADPSGQHVAVDFAPRAAAAV